VRETWLLTINLVWTFWRTRWRSPRLTLVYFAWKAERLSQISRNLLEIPLPYCRIQNQGLFARTHLSQYLHRETVKFEDTHISVNVRTISGRWAAGFGPGIQITLFAILLPHALATACPRLALGVPKAERGVVPWCTEDEIAVVGELVN
jgi:hypothetical protein